MILTDDQKQIWIAVYADHFQRRNAAGSTYANAAIDAMRQADRAVHFLEQNGGVPLTLSLTISEALR